MFQALNSNPLNHLLFSHSEFSLRSRVHDRSSYPCSNPKIFSSLDLPACLRKGRRLRRQSRKMFPRQLV